MIQDLDELLDKLDASREQMLVALEELPDAALTAPAAVGQWAISDLLAVLTAWDAELITGLMRLEQNKRPDPLLAALQNPEAYEAACVRNNEERHIDQIFEDWQRARMQLEGWLESFSWRNLTKPGRYQWFGQQPLVDVVLAVTIAREQHFLPAVVDFANQWAETAVSPPPATFIPLTSLDPEQPDDNPSPN